MIFSLLFLILTPTSLCKVSLWNPSPIFLTHYLWLLFLFYLSVYTQIYFLNIHIFQMAHFNWLLRTKLIMRIIELLIVAIFPWHHIWRGSISDVLFKVLNVANGKSPGFLQSLPLTSNLRAFALAVSSAWNALPSALCLAGFFSLLKSSGMSFHREVFSEGPF